MRVATEAITDPYGGLYYHTQKLKKLSSFKIREVPSKMIGKLLCRSRVFKMWYRDLLMEKGLKGFEIVHSRSDPWFIEVCKRARSEKCVWIQTFHAIFHAEDYQGGLQSWQVEQNKAVLETGRNADIKISVSEWGHDLLKQKYSIDTIVIQNGADLEVCDKADSERFLKKYRLKDFILFVGSFREVKDPGLFIRLAQRMPDVNFVMVGDRVEAKFLSEKYKINIPFNIKCLGRLAHLDVLDAMAACRIYVMTSKHEGLPNTLLEAMGIGKTVVVPDHSGCREVVGDENIGFLYNNHDMEDLIIKIRAALNSPEKGINARKRIEEKFNCVDKVKQLDEIYKNAFDLRRKRG